ncbi:UdgX family uracil-DNA binding protein [Actinacidiphila sp. DG2A-62]|uniref:UdgX family uracil-DNA binding protein n=1 Tax=Actinacidiphila sp. DG2A-62 TaxID=3108821 RepID=UPI002DBD42C2|nr:UdgX family uracil-DNA binding protein [Actinacidiphila sp. DG2A-62]MEC3998451.1 UdgX family uracil-DNA binding protein [Actinacidiphila sp. DG2A-62]
MDDGDKDGGDGGNGRGYDATPYLPERGGLPAHRATARDCRGCPLYRDATQTVFGEGTASARLMMVGEQPGDKEDLDGEPFVGPAGRLLRKALDEAGLADEKPYVTNAVKHFKYTPVRRASGAKQRIHKPPTLREMSACRPWLAAELRLVGPEAVVALGATAGRALLGPSFRVGPVRGTVLPLPAPDALGAPAPGDAAAGEGPGAPRAWPVPTVHPSSVLRADDREAAYDAFVADLRVAAGLLRD